MNKNTKSHGVLIAVIALLITAVFIILIITSLHYKQMQLLHWQVLTSLIIVVILALVLLIRFFLKSRILAFENKKYLEEQKIYEQKLIKAQRLYLFISQINQMLLKTSDETTLYKDACNIAVNVGKFRMAWIGFIDEQTKVIKPFTHAGIDLDYLSVIKIIGDINVPEGRGPTASAILEGQYFFSNDIETDPRMLPWRTEALKRNYYSVISLPIIRSGKAIGAFTLYADTKNFFDEAEITLLNETARDISFALEIFETKKIRETAEKLVIESERRYHTLAESSPVGIFHTDATGYTTYVNPRWTTISGVSFEAALGNGWLNAVHEDDKQKLVQGWEEATKNHLISSTQYRFVRPDGSVAWVLGQAVPEKNNENEIIGYVGTITDITQQKKSELQIAQARDLSLTIINSLPGIFYLYDENRRFLRWNKNFEKVSGYTAEEIKNMHPLDFFSNEEKELLEEKISNTFKYGQDQVEAKFQLKNKEQIAYYFTGKLIEYENVSCLMGVGIDITERVEAQERIKETSEELRQLALHLQTIREEERKRIGREIHDELGQQLTAIKMDVAWIDKKVPEEYAHLKTKIKNVIALLDGSNKSIRRILSELRPGVLEDNDLVDALQWLGKQFSANTGISVTFNKPEKITKVAQPLANCIFRVYQEALTNITRYAEAKNVFTTIIADEQNIALTIKDDGKGFDAATIKNKKSFGLLGMKERVHSLNGRFDLISSPGLGTTINIFLPLQSQKV